MPQPVQIVSPWGSKEDRARERNDKRDAVITAAVRLFNLNGFHATSLDDVAKVLRVTKPTIYHYYSSKDEILFECVRRGLNGIRDAAAEAATHGGVGLERLQILIHAYALIKTRDFGICVGRTSDDQLRPESRAKFRAMKREINDILQGVVSEGMADGSIAKGDARLYAFTIAGSLNWITRWYDPSGSMTPEDIADGMMAMLTDGLVPRE
ncbi:MAG: TetR family transcriptional regulator [Rhodobacteraceae bacterium]|nr:TetR family transcriptional regulator [Paracoccaceae bacterium]PHR55661.1 MAG: TetR family transcriptional regulator [Robiginitomaculum sp.]